MPHQRLVIEPMEAAKQLGISTKTLMREVDRGRLRYVLVGKRKKFDPQDLRNYVEAQKQSCLSTSPRGAKTGRLTSRSKVVDFDTARAKRLKQWREESKKASDNE